jgi:hypothetical protein
VGGGGSGAAMLLYRRGRWAVRGRSDCLVVVPSMAAVSRGDAIRGRGNGGKGGEAMSQRYFGEEEAVLGRPGFVAQLRLVQRRGCAVEPMGVKM